MSDVKPASLRLVLGDQLSRDNPVLRDADPACDWIWMAEVPTEATHVWSHKARIALFLSAMRHFRDELKAAGYTVIYHVLDTHDFPSLRATLDADLEHYAPAQVLCTQPGDWRVRNSLADAVRFRADTHFLCASSEFADWARGRKRLVMEHFYRRMRKAHAVLMDDGKPAGGAWNFDKSNRKSFGREGPGMLPPPPAFQPDRITREVLTAVEEHFGTHPGSLAQFNWPVTRQQALAALDDFITHRLPAFGAWQDALWTGEPFLYHSLLSAALNLKLLNPREVIAAAEAAWQKGHADIAAAEGFIRQILGWREYVRGIYWLTMPDYLERNALNAQDALPDFYWTGETDMQCLHEVISQTLEFGYAHHIQRLMVTGLYALLLGVRPQAVHEWYLAVYVDAVEWVELPNTLGMSQFGDGGLLGTKPYAATGKYIQRMSNYCDGCRFDPAQRTGDNACPFTTLYWDFLDRNRNSLADNHRLGFQYKNLDRISVAEMQAIRKAARRLRNG